MSSYNFDGGQVVLLEETIVSDLHTTGTGSALSYTGPLMISVIRSSFRYCSASSNREVIFLNIQNKYDINWSCFCGCYSEKFGCTLHATSVETAVNIIH